MNMLQGQIIKPASGKTKNLVVFLHGYGANGADLLSIGEEWAEYLPDTAFAAPDAPDACEMNAAGFQWFAIRAADGISNRVFERDEVIKAPAAKLNAYLDKLMQDTGVPDSRLAVIGFSQGAMMAMYTMPRRAKPCAGVIGYSGLLVHADGLKGATKIPVLAIHGDADTVVPPVCLDGVQQGFEAAGFDVETILRPHLGHGIDQFGLVRGLEFLREAFEKPEKIAV